MINIFAAIGFGIKILSKESGVQLLSDAKLLYPYWAPLKAGKLDFAVMHKNGELIPALKALKRTVDTLDLTIQDKIADQDFLQILESMPDV